MWHHLLANMVYLLVASYWIGSKGISFMGSVEAREKCPMNLAYRVIIITHYSLDNNSSLITYLAVKRAIIFCKGRLFALLCNGITRRDLLKLTTARVHIYDWLWWYLSVRVINCIHAPTRQQLPICALALIKSYKGRLTDLAETYTK